MRQVGRGALQLSCRIGLLSRSCEREIVASQSLFFSELLLRRMAAVNETQQERVPEKQMATQMEPELPAPIIQYVLFIFSLCTAAVRAPAPNTGERVSVSVVGGLCWCSGGGEERRKENTCVRPCVPACVYVS